MTATKGTRVEILHVQSPGYWKAGQYGYIVGHSDRGGMWLQDRSGESHTGESVYLVSKTKDGRSGSLWFSASALRRTGTKRTANKTGTKRTAKHRNRSAHTRAPVTVSGWYEHSDGTIGHYVWRSGNLVLDQVVPSWSDVESAKSEALSDEPMNYAGGKRTAKRSSNRAGTKRRATKKTANKAGKRRNRAGTPKRSARTGRFVSR